MDAEALLLLAEGERARGDIKSALAAAEKAVALDDKNLGACVLLAEVLAQLQQPARARALAQYVLLTNESNEALAERAERVWVACGGDGSA